MNDFVSVIIPVYNRVEQLKRAIESVINQSFADFELIIIDDGSSLDIKSVISSFNDNRIVYLKNEQNKGVSYSRNRGILSSKGKYISFLDSDDKWFKRKLEEQVKFFKENRELRLVHTEEIWIKNGKRMNQKKRHKKSSGDIFERSLELCLISPSTVMIKREIFDKYGYFDESLPVCEDYDLWIRITAFEKIGFIEKPLIYKYGGHSDQLSRKYEAMDRFRVISMMNLFKNNNLPNDRREAIKSIALKKISILISGAKKRDKLSDLELYLKWHDFFVGENCK